MIPAIICNVVHVHDGDGPLWCRTGEKIRIAGIQAPDYEDAEPCIKHRAGYACDNVAADRSRRITERLTLHQRLVCQPLGTSYRRIVARCSVGGVDLSCRLIAVGAAVVWRSYWVRYGMGECPR